MCCVVWVPGNGSSPGHGVDHVLAAVRLRRPGGAIHPCRLAHRASDPVRSPRKQSASKTGKEVSRTTTTTPKTAARLSCRLRGAKAQPRHRVVGDEDGVSKISSIAFLTGARRRGPPPLACHRHLLACHHHPAPPNNRYPSCLPSSRRPSAAAVSHRRLGGDRDRRPLTKAEAGRLPRHCGAAAAHHGGHRAW